ncbi:fibrous sheath-interacting protein 1 [Engraulis encrasicolus]|uniref:fibrous sheath-interacting protein 1 n=1 Tax=Engraulis encrasicolus TaxID=184585 RepID=UPI002FD1F61D
MEITWGGLEDISRPASSERTRSGSRVSTSTLAEGGRISRSSPTSLEVLSSDIEDKDKVHTMVLQAKRFPENSFDEDCSNEQVPSDKETSQTDGEEEECEDLELQKAFKKMERLDKILSQRISNEKEVKKRGRELSQQLWRELEVWTNCYQESTVRSGSREAIENTKLFFALTSSTCQESSKVPDVVPVFGTQIPEKEYEKHSNEEHVEGSKRSDSARTAKVEGEGVKMDDQGSVTQEKGDKGNEEEEGDKVEEEDRDKPSKVSSRQMGSAAGKQQTQDFVKKNIELASSGLHVPMTVDEKQRLSQLLQDIDEETADQYSPADCQEVASSASACVLSIRLGEGYTPQPSELDQLVQIDARLQTLLPPEDFLSVRSPYPDHGLPQVFSVASMGAASGPGSGLGLGLGPVVLDESAPGERVLQALRERKGQEERLRHIQQQLDTLEQRQADAVELPRLPEEQLQRLLLECELAQSRAPSLAGTRHPYPYSHPGSSRATSTSVASVSEMEGEDADADGDGDVGSEGEWSSSLGCTPRLSSAALEELLRDYRMTSTKPQEAEVPAEEQGEGDAKEAKKEVEEEEEEEKEVEDRDEEVEQRGV